MPPTYPDGDQLLVRRSRGRALRSGEVTPAPPDLAEIGPGWLIKRVTATAGDAVPADVRAAVGHAEAVPHRRLVVRGDNPHSRDSRRFGFCG